MVPWHERHFGVGIRRAGVGVFCILLGVFVSLARGVWKMERASV
jgi:hypothetical protein